MSAYSIPFCSTVSHCRTVLALLLGLASITIYAMADGNAQSVSEDWYAYDSNGNVILLTDEAAKPTARYQYDAFGKTLSATGPAAESNTYRFSTKPIETGSGLAFYGFRYYSPELGRWPSRDPILESGGLNLFLMTGNDTLGAVDYLGKYELSYRVEQMTIGNRGGHIWDVKFVLSAATPTGGIIMQRVTYPVWNIQNCDGTARNSSSPSKFFEVFQVAPNASESQADEWGMNESSCPTKGEIKIKGKAVFYDGMSADALPSDFAIDPNNPSNGVGPTSEDRWFFPSGADSNFLTRILHFRWSDCPGDKWSDFSVE
ncbi:MAG: RHS repeat-associated core domain-containing protein [Verrucomicrobiaceae bacterium]|nr:RHS repeat-associated core domain-containing protein [Verrucomicrobiaceae bacterium]